MKDLSLRGSVRTSLRCLSSLRSAAFAALTLGVIGAWSTPASAQTKPAVGTTEPEWVREKRAHPHRAKEILAANRIEWCGTDQEFERRYPRMSSRITGVCQTFGPPDDPAVRNAAIPTATTPFKYIRVKFNILANDDGSSPTATVEDAEGQLAQLNADFASARIRFVSTGVRFCNSTRFRNIANITTELDALKNTFADQPDKQLNFYVTEVEQANPRLLGMATFTWDPNATGKLGGFFCDNNAFGKGKKTATHEIGHCLGLWHPFHGVEEVAEDGCQGCRELAGRSAADGDITGDYASDTPPTSRNYQCGPPVNDPETPADETKDACNGQSWGTTDWSNFMGYASDECLDHFTPQQMGRMHAWINAKLSGWLVNTAANAPPFVTYRSNNQATGLGPIVVQFSQPMNVASTQSAFVMTPATTGTFAWSDGNQTMTFTPAALATGTLYTATVRGSAQSAASAAVTLDGNSNGTSQGSPTDDHSWVFRTSGAAANDNFANATNLAGTSGNMTGYNGGATKETGEPTHYSITGDNGFIRSAGNSVWYKWTANVLGNANIRVDSNIDPTVAVYEGTSLGTLTKIAGSGTNVTWRTVPGTTYYIVVDSLYYYLNGKAYPVVTGSFTINWMLYPSPANDFYAGATAITGTTGFTTGNNMGAYSEANEPYTHSGRDSSMWYKWVAPANGCAIFDTEGSAFDTTLGVYTGASMSTATFVANDNDGGSGSLSKMPFTVVGGTTYYIVVGGNGSGFSGPRGNFKINWSFVTAPTNDLFANAIALSPATSGRANGTNVGANKENGEPDPTFGSANQSIWYTWTAPSNGAVTFDTHGSAFNTMLAVYTGTSVSGLQEVAYNNDDAANEPITTSRVKFTAIAGTVYRIMVNNGGYANNSEASETYPAKHGATVLNWSFATAPANDLFANATTLAVAGGTMNGTNVGANKENGEPDFTFGSGNQSIWYKWTPTASGVLTIDTSGSAINTALAVYTGGVVNGLQEVASNNDDAASDPLTFSKVKFTAVAGTTYRIQVNNGGWASGDSAQKYDILHGPIKLNWAFTAAPANDLFANAQVIPVAGGEVQGTTVGANVENGEPDFTYGSGGQSIWYKWTPTANGAVTFHTAGSKTVSGLDYNTTLAVYTGPAVNALEEVATNNDDASAEPLTYSKIKFTAVMGRSYYIRVDNGAWVSGDVSQKYDASHGTTVLSWDFIPAPPNDFFGDAQLLSPTNAGKVTGTNIGATLEVSEQDPTYGSGGSSVWYKWTAPGSGNVTIDTLGSTFNTMLSVFTGGTMAGAEEVASNNDDGNLTTSKVTFAAQGGTEYRIRVDSGGWASGDVSQKFDATHGDVIVRWSYNGAPIQTPNIAGFTPASGGPGTSVTITGGTFTGATAVQFNGVPGTITSTTATQIVATAPAGVLTGRINVVTPNGTATSTTNFLVPPTVTSFTPTSGNVGATVTITGTGFSRVSDVLFNGVGAPFGVNSLTQITATVPFGATTGKISVVTNGGTGTSAANFSVAPQITGFTPSGGSAGTVVTISGLNFTGATGVQFNNTTATFTVLSATSIRATVPAGATTGTIKVTTAIGTATSPNNFIIEPAPTITSFTPASGDVGAVVTINGTNFTNATTTTPTLTFYNGRVATVVTVVSANQLTAVVPSFATTGPISVTTTGGTATSGNFFTVNGTAPPTAYSISGRITTSAGAAIANVSVSRGGGATPVLTNASGDYTLTGVLPGTYTITPTLNGHVFTPATRTVTVTNANVASQNFTGAVVPTITSFTPTSGVVGASVTITGTGFTGATAVRFNGTSATFTVASATQITATVPTGATTGTISVTTPGGTATSTASFTVTGTYSISGRITNSANAAIANVSVTRTGSTTAVLTNATGDFTFTGVSAGTYTITPALANHVFAPVNRSVTITNANVTGQNFTGTPAPTVTSFSPTSGTVGASVTINGTGFTGATAVRFNGTSATFTVNSATQIVAVVPAAATTGKISVTTPGGTATSTGDFTVIVTYTISGRITNSATGAAISGVTVARTGSSTTVLTNGSGDFTFTGVPAGTYTIAPSLAQYNFTPANRSVTVTNANVTGQNFTGVGSIYSIRGRFTNHSGSPLPNTQITCTGRPNAIVDANGDFAFNNLPPGTYTIAPLITPSLNGVTLFPTSRSVTITTSSQGNQNFTASFSVNGKVSNSLGVGIPNIQVQRIAGASVVSVFTDANGNYRFTNVYSGTYTVQAVVTPAMTGMTFYPATTSITVDKVNLTNINFTAWFTITGRVADSSNVGIPNIQVRRAAGASVVSTFTDANGNYRFPDTRSGDYTITPTANNRTFNPVSRAVTVNTLNLTNINFTGSGTGTPPPATYSISGRITDSGTGNGIANVSVTRTGSTTAVLTNANGDYTFTGVFAGTYTITPALNGYTFTPTSRSVTVGSTNVTGQNFIGAGAPSTPAPTVTGFTPTSGPVGTSVVITGTNLTGATAVRFNTTNATTFTVNSATQITATVPAGATTGKISVTTPGGTGSSTGDFTVTTPTYSISGRITTGAGAAISGVSVTRTGSATAVTTNATGDFTFTGLAAGTYTITPSLTNYTFNPVNRSVTITNANVTAQNFTGTQSTPAPTITSFTPNSGAVGATVTITGTNFTGATAVRFNGTNATTFTVNSATQITATVPTGATTGKVSITTAGGTATSVADFTVTTALPPAFVDNFADARFITGATGTLTGSNVGMTREANEPTIGDNSGGASVWCKWTAPGTGNFVFTTAGSSFDTIMGIATGSSLATLTGVANDDEQPGVIFTSRIVLNATAGTTYYIVIDGYNGDTGNITLGWSQQ